MLFSAVFVINLFSTPAFTKDPANTPSANAEQLKELEPDSVNKQLLGELKRFYKRNQKFFESLDLKRASQIVNTISEDHNEPEMTLEKALEGARKWVSNYEKYPLTKRKYEAALKAYQTRIDRLQGLVETLSNRETAKLIAWPLKLTLPNSPSNDTKVIEDSGQKRVERKISFTERAREVSLPPIHNVHELKAYLALEKESLKEAEDIYRDLIYSHAAHSLFLSRLQEHLKDYENLNDSQDSEIVERHALYKSISAALSPDRPNADQLKPDADAMEHVAQAYETSRLLRKDTLTEVRHRLGFFHDHLRPLGSLFGDYADLITNTLVIVTFLTVIGEKTGLFEMAKSTTTSIISAFDTRSAELKQAIDRFKQKYDFFWKITVEWKAQDSQSFLSGFVRHAHTYFPNRSIEIWLEQKQRQYETGINPNFETNVESEKFFYERAAFMEEIFQALLKGEKAPEGSGMDDLPPLGKKFDEMNRINSAVDELLQEIKKNGLEGVQNYRTPQWGPLGFHLAPGPLPTVKIQVPPVVPSSPSTNDGAENFSLKSTDCVTAVAGAATSQPAKQ